MSAAEEAAVPASGPGTEGPPPGEPAVRAPAIARGVVLQVLARGAAFPLSLLTVAVATRYLGPQGYGVLTTAIVLAGMFEALTELGVGAVVVRRVSGRGDSLEHLVGLSVAISLTYALPLALLAAGAGVVVYAGQPQVQLACVIVAGGLVWRTLATSLDPVFDVRLEYRAVAVADVAARALGLAAVVAVVGTEAGLLALCAAMTVPHLVRCVIVAVGALRLMPARPRWRGREALALLRESLPLTVVAVVGIVYWNADGFLLTLMSDHAEVAAYGLSLQIAFALAVVPVVFGRAALGPISAAFHTDRERFAGAVDRAYRFLLLCAVPVAAFGAVLAPRIVTVVSGPAFTAVTGPVLRVFFVAVALMFLTAISGDVLIAAGDQAWLTGLSVANLVGNVALNLGLIPLLGALGAGVALVCSELSGVVLAHRRIRRRHGARAFPLGAVLRLGVGVVLGLALVRATWSLPLAVVLLAGGLGYLAGARLAGALPRDLLATLRAAFPRPSRSRPVATPR